MKQEDFLKVGRMLLAFMGIVLGAGCGGAGDEDGPISWWHREEGGVIAQNRPPPPGNDQPYPYVGNTPSTIPPVPSMEYRNSLTQRLVEQRNLQERLNAGSSIEESVAQIKQAEIKQAVAQPAQSSAKQSKKTEPAQGEEAKSLPPSSALPESAPSTASVSRPAADVPVSGTPGMVFDAADGEQSTVQNSANGDTVGEDEKEVEKKTAKKGNSSQEQEVALPDFNPALAGQDKGGTPLVQTSGPLPEVPVIPPASPHFPNFDIPADSHLPDRVLPAYALADPPGQLVRFPVDSDTLTPGQDASISSFVLKNVGYHILVNGYGDARSTAPAVQAQALNVALLRAKAVAAILESKGVPAEYIQISAYAFGHGVRLVKGG